MKSWYRIENRADPNLATQVYLYDEIGGWGVSASDFVTELRAIDTGSIELHINSPGGSVFDGMAIYNAIRNHPADVNVIVDGVAASAASFVAMAGDTIVAERNATMMIHDGIGVAVGNAQDMRELAKVLEMASNNIASIYAERAGGSTEEWRGRMRAETWYSAQEAKDAGLVDEIRGGKAKAAPSNKWDLSLFQYASRPDAPAPTNHAPPAPKTDPPAEAGFLMPALDLAGIRDSVASLEDIPFDPDLIKAAVALAVYDAPAPDQAPPPAPDPEPELSINLPDIRRVMREVTK